MGSEGRETPARDFLRAIQSLAPLSRPSRAGMDEVLTGRRSWRWFESREGWTSLSAAGEEGEVVVAREELASFCCPVGDWAVETGSRDLAAAAERAGAASYGEWEERERGRGVIPIWLERGSSSSLGPLHLTPDHQLERKRVRMVENGCTERYPPV